MSPPRIDSHQHLWRLDRGDYRWLAADNPALAPLQRDFAPDDALPLLQAGGIQQVVLVQAADSEAETDFLLDIARSQPWVGGVVGWVDMTRPQSADTLARWAREPKFKGVRPMLQDLADDDWINHAPHPAALQALLDLGLRFDALVLPHQLPALLRFVRTWPTLPVVIDHAAKPQLAQGWPADWAAPWLTHMAQLAAQPQVLCKLSGLLTECAPGTADDLNNAVAVLQPVWQHLLASFGPQRLMWGSDWPVLTLAAPHARWLQISQALVAKLPAADQAAVWAGNAACYYGLDLNGG